MRPLLQALGRWTASNGPWLLALALAAACGKTNQSLPGSEPNDPSGGGGAGGVPDSAGAPVPVGGDGGLGGGTTSELTPLPGALRRLTAAEYEATVADVLGTSRATRLAEFTTEVDGFDNNATANRVSEQLYLRYLETAEALATEVFESEALRGRIVLCGEEAGAAECSRQIASQVGLRVLRRPLLEDELIAYEKVYARARARSLDHDNAVKEVLIALLASAAFVYRMEFVPTEAGVQALGAYDVATRLSYLLWSSAPDASLLDAAERGALSTDQELEVTVDRLLADPKSRRFSENFGGQWLGARRLIAPVQGERALTLPRPLAVTAAGELTAWFDDLLRQNLAWASFFQSPTHFVDAELGTVYGLEVSGDALQRIELRGVDRRGFLGLVAFLAQAAVRPETSPSARGRWIQEHLRCQSGFEPPTDMPSFDGSPAMLRQHLESLNSDPACSNCHAQIDPLGLALERYGVHGHERDTYLSYQPINAQVTLSAALAPPAGASIDGISGLSDVLARDPAFTACTVRKVYTYGFGRAFAATEQHNVQTLAEQWQAGDASMRALLLHLVLSPTFRSRSDGGEL